MIMQLTVACVEGRIGKKVVEDEGEELICFAVREGVTEICEWAIVYTCVQVVQL